MIPTGLPPAGRDPAPDDIHGVWIVTFTDRPDRWLYGRRRADRQTGGKEEI